MDMNYHVARKAMKLVSAVIRRIREMNSLERLAKVVSHRDFYSISIYTGPSPLDLNPRTGNLLPVLSSKDVTDICATYVADPFMIRVDGCWYMYFEILQKDIVKGVIGLATSRNGLEWAYQQVTLEEPFHLSYPCVFESEGEYYMIPESIQAGAVRLYKADPFPTRWTFMANILDDVEYVDCSPFRFHGKWWLFAGCGAPPLYADTLRLFHADRLTGPWSEHPASPVIFNNPHIARPGGRVVLWENRLFRFCQDCSPHYGLRVHAFEIVELTDTSYKEVPALEGPVLKESGNGWNSSGMHHMDPHPAEGGGCIACVDGWYWGPIDF